MRTAACRLVWALAVAMGCCDWCCSIFCCCCYRSRYQKADAHTQPLNLLPPKAGSVDELLERTLKARADAWRQLGRVHPINTSYLKAATKDERSKWPAKRQAYQMIERPSGSVILASDGLSDPFDDATLGACLTAPELLLLVQGIPTARSHLLCR